MIGAPAAPRCVWYLIAVSSRQVDGSPSSSGSSNAAGWLRSIAARSMVSISAKSAGSSRAADAPWRTSSARTRSRTRPCSSAMTASVEALTSGAWNRALKTLGGARPHGQRCRGRGDDLVFLLQSERHAIIAGQLECVIAGVASLDAALARLVRVAVFGILGDRSVIPVPLHGGAVELGVVVRTAPDVNDGAHTERCEAGGRC